jgi:hypothetical protein
LVEAFIQLKPHGQCLHTLRSKDTWQQQLSITSQLWVLAVCIILATGNTIWGIPWLQMFLWIREYKNIT